MARRQPDVAWSDPALLILGHLASGPKHGYGIVQDTKSTVGTTRYGKLATVFRAAAVLNAVIAWTRHLSDMH